MPMHLIGGLANPARPVASRSASRRRRTVESRQQPFGVRYMRAFKSISRGADEIFMVGNETGMPSGMPVGRVAASLVAVAALPFALDHVRSLWPGAGLHVLLKGALTLGTGLDTPGQRAGEPVASRRGAADQGTYLSHEHG